MRTRSRSVHIENMPRKLAVISDTIASADRECGAPLELSRKKRNDAFARTLA